MAEEPVALGRRVARRFMPRGLRPRPSELAAQMKVEVVLLEAPPPAQPRLRSEYAAAPPRIILYTDSIAALEARFEIRDSRLLLTSRAGCTPDLDSRISTFDSRFRELHIAHELFHHLESGQRFGPLTGEEVEAAAHSFAKELLGADFEPEELSRLMG